MTENAAVAAGRQDKEGGRIKWLLGYFISKKRRMKPAGQKQAAGSKASAGGGERGQPKHKNLPEKIAGQYHFSPVLEQKSYFEKNK